MVDCNILVIISYWYTPLPDKLSAEDCSFYNNGFLHVLKRGSFIIYSSYYTKMYQICKVTKQPKRVGIIYTATFLQDGIYRESAFYRLKVLWAVTYTTAMQAYLYHFQSGILATLSGNLPIHRIFPPSRGA